MSRNTFLFILIFCHSTLLANPFEEILDSGSQQNWYRIKSGIQLDVSTFFEMATVHFNLENNEFRFVKSHKDNHGNLHDYYQQYRNGVMILGSEIILHSNASGIYLVNGVIANYFQDEVKISEDHARAIISEKYPCLSNSNSESEEKKEDKIELIYFRKETGKDQFQLSYIINNNCINPLEKKHIVLDAASGEVLFENADVQNCNTHIHKDTLIYNGQQQINIYQNNDTFELQDICRISIDHPIKVMSGFGANPVELIRSANKELNNNLEIPALQLLWSMTMYYDFLKMTLNRNSFDNKYSTMVSTLDSAMTATAGFSFSGSNSFHGKGAKNKLNYWVSLDIVGHEWTHGLLFSENVLKWTNESQSLAESICDIFGTMCERYAERLFDQQKTEDWTIAEDCDSSALRDLSDPQNYGNPETYNSAIYLNSNDKYHRSAVNSFWFYLLSKGGKGWNNHASQSYYYNLSGISEEKALLILYKAISDYLTPVSEFKDMRLATLQSAEDLYGICSYEFLNTLEAWNAVGVYDSISYCNTGTYLSDSELSTISRVFPNPVNGRFSIRVKTFGSQVKFSLYNHSGQEVNFELESISGNEFQIRSKSLSKGMYTLKIQSPSKVESHKLVFISSE